MSKAAESDTMAAEKGRMRVETIPVWPEALEAAARRMIAGANGSLRELRQAALEALRKIGLPTAGSEDFSYVRPNDFAAFLSAVPEHAADGKATGTFPVPKTVIMPTPELVRSLIFPEAKDNYVVLLDGEYSPALSNVGPGLKVNPLEAAATGSVEAPAAHLLSILQTTLSRETDAAAALASLFAVQPLLIQVDAGTTGIAPLQILHLRTAAQPTRRDAFLILSAGRLSEARILVRHAEALAGKPSAAGSMDNAHTLIHVEEGASVKWLEAAPEGAGIDADVHFHKLTALIERDARLFTLAATTGSKLARNAYAVDLRGQGAEAEINGATVLAAARQAHHFVQVRHLVPHGTSRQHFKTVAADRSRASVDGTIVVSEGAQLTNANQLINNLMLSDEARADSKPRLLIHADDVKCTHGATAGKLDPDQQFYLESRGLSAAQARALLTLAFIAEVLERADRAAGSPNGPSSPARSGFRAHLDASLLATLKQRLASERSPAAAPETP